MASPTQTRGQLKNVTGCTANLVFSSNDGAPKMVKESSTPTPFTLNITSNDLLGGMVYDLNGVKWVNVWTTDCKVCTKFYPPGEAVVWVDLWNSLQPNTSTDQYTPDMVYSSEANVSANPDGSLNFNATVIMNYCNKN